ncbi:hypothetical protein E3N88_15791 [Mikania micrantha]|uniref:Uncharacterized protein n=1 Tax=Mikania micrantha TaxID=192012 RepID=A0A5N6NY83_9ASTR|nr:hypothetical protein E3N88_15791 [Mikania micrantha]
MTSSSSSYKYKKDEKAIEILEKSFSTEKKDDRIMRNSIGMLNGLLLAGIRSNIANLSDLLDDIGEGVEIAQDYMVNQLMMNEEIHGGLKDLLNVTIDKIKKKRDGKNENEAGSDEAIDHQRLHLEKPTIPASLGISVYPPDSNLPEKITNVNHEEDNRSDVQVKTQMLK